MAADESWCLRLVLSTGQKTAGPDRVLARIQREFVIRAKTDPAGTDAFYEAWHLGMLLADGITPIDPSPIRAVFSDWADAHADPARAGGSDIVEWANLAGSHVLDLLGDTGSALRDRAVGILLRRQAGDGCWVIPDARPPRLASSFLTMRALMALQRYRDAGTVAGGRSVKPAPKADRPAQ